MSFQILNNLIVIIYHVFSKDITYQNETLLQTIFVSLTQ